MTTTRPVTADDVPALTALVRANRRHLAPWEPVRPEEYFTADGQTGVVRAAQAARRAGTGLVHVVLDDDGALVGRVALSGIVRGALQSGALSYWVDAERQGRGVATTAVAALLRVAFDDLLLHRVQAETLPHNAGSRRVLERNGFERFGVAPAYLRIAGRWQDHVMYQRLTPHDVPGG